MRTIPNTADVGITAANWDNTQNVPVLFSTADHDIRVTRANIRAAVPGNPDQCAFALAALAFPGAVGARFWNSVAYIYYADHIIRYDLDGRSTRAIRAFDANGGLSSEPGMFTLHAVKPSNYPAVKAVSNAHYRNLRSVYGYTPNRAARGTRTILTSIGVRNGTGTVRGNRAP